MPKTGEILIYEVIGENWYGDGLTGKSFAQKLAALGDVDEINVRINSPGGSVFDGTAIYNQLLNHPAKIIVDIDGIAASAASYVAMAGDTVRIADNGFMMIHRAMGFAMGNTKEMTKLAATLEKLDGSIAATYAKKTGREASEHLNQMDVETWFDAKDAKEAGLVDEITDGQSEPTNILKFKAVIEAKFTPPAALKERLSVVEKSLAASAALAKSKTIEGVARAGAAEFAAYAQKI